MNAFANALFSVLFSGIRSIIEGIWSAVASGRLSRFFSWLGDYWLIVVAVICAGATCMDYLVWLIRWRPYLIWSTKLRRLFSRPSHRRAEADRRFARGYQGGVNLDISDTMGAPMEEAWDDPALWEQPAPQPPVQEVQTPYVPDAYAAPGEPDAPLFNPSQNDPLPGAYASQPAPEEYAPQIPVYQRIAYDHSDYAVSPAAPAFQDAPQETKRTAMADPLPASPAGRNPRRGRTVVKKRIPLHARLTASDEDEGMLDGLPPVVDRDQAFHQPVYPQREAGAGAPGTKEWMK